MSTALDTNVLNYLLEAVTGGDPRLTDGTEAAEQRIAVVRLFLWHQDLHVGRIALGEATHPRNPIPELQDFVYSCLGEIWVDDEIAWHRRADELGAAHMGARNRNDCLIVAEAEMTGCDRIVTFDGTMRKRFTDHARIAIQTPAQRWTELEIPEGTPPRWTPDPRSALAATTAWHW